MIFQRELILELLSTNGALYSWVSEVNPLRVLPQVPPAGDELTTHLTLVRE